jgi:predicted transcriptional regulator
MMIDELHRLDSGDEAETVSSKRRSQLEIYLDIINAIALRPLRPTHIMKTANVSYNELKKIIELLERKSLVLSETTFDGKFYQATPEGLRLVEEYKRFRSSIFE